MRFFEWLFGGSKEHPARDYEWQPCDPPIFPRRTVDGGKTLLKSSTWRRRAKDGGWEYTQKPQTFEDWETDQW